MKPIFVATAPLTVQTHLGNPRMARIPELTIRQMPECEGGGWYMPVDQAEAIASAWNSRLTSTGENGMKFFKFTNTVDGDEDPIFISAETEAAAREAFSENIGEMPASMLIVTECADLPEDAEVIHA